MKRNIRPALIILALILGACQPGDSTTDTTAAQASATGVWNVEKKREWASRLAAEGLRERALEVYEDILSSGEGLSEAAVAGISITIADIHVAAGRFEAALASLYRAKLFPLDPKVDRDVEQKRIMCFEKLGRSTSADRLLDKVTALDKKERGDVVVGGEVLAEIGEEQVTRADFDGLMAQLSPEVRDRLTSKEHREEALKGIVARRVLMRKARKLALDQDDGVRRAVNAASEEIMVRKLLADEVQARVKIVPDDVKLYFEAHPEKFKTPARLELAHVVVADEAAEAAVRAALEQGITFEVVVAESSSDAATKLSGGKIAEPVVEGEFHADFVNVSEVFAAVADAKSGDVTRRSVVTSKGRHVLKVLDRTPGTVHTFEDSKERAESMLRSEREQAALKELFDQAVTSSDIKIHAERL